MYQELVKEETIQTIAGTYTPSSTTVVAIKNVLGCDLRDEAVILDLQSGVYYGLDPVGARIWELVQNPITIAEVCDAILDEYDVQRDQCERDLYTFLDELSVNGLIELRR